ncbi:hypothetical protein SAMN02787144_1006113 [Streptomyces atratus]|uniref:Uncharacterized protein n=1 Tax=Streptomyces atratus TaxID=1893 RepID=A0A1K1ZUF0_STRAR|nr:hypothetical protein SAMN02787144_1006113 [Streptomyces atratus]
MASLSTLVGDYPLSASLALPSTATVAVELAPTPALPSTEPPQSGAARGLRRFMSAVAAGKGELIAVFGVPVISETHPFR